MFRSWRHFCNKFAVKKILFHEFGSKDHAEKFFFNLNFLDFNFELIL